MPLRTEIEAHGDLLTRPLPSHLYHYTDPAGAIGILSSRTLWAGHPSDMNDSSEQLLAHEIARQLLSSLRFPGRSYGEGMVEYALELLDRERHRVFRAPRSYTVSLSSERDSLEQWRAYCPRSGGVALGFSAKHLAAVAKDQGFTLAACIYDEQQQEKVMRLAIGRHLRVWDEHKPLNEKRQGISSHLVRELIADLDRHAPFVKHGSFAAEREWRLISPPISSHGNPNLIYVPSSSGIKQFKSFSLVTKEHPIVERVGDQPGMPGFVDSEKGFRPVIGPSIDPDRMEEAILGLTPEEFGMFFSVERTTSPFR